MCGSREAHTRTQRSDEGASIFSASTQHSTFFCTAFVYRTQEKRMCLARKQFVHIIFLLNSVERSTWAIFTTGKPTTNAFSLRR
uniref:Uncharacterized protein n=1 Tax=Ascaris lumbricoides TaxID=6252 RepID=A0A0M3HSH4_ASCLU